MPAVLAPPPKVIRDLPNNDIDMTLTTANGQTKFVDGEHFALVLRTNIDCHVAVLSHSSDSESVILFPNTYNTDTRIPAKKFISIPDKVGDLNKTGFKFTVKAPFGHDVMEVIACTDPHELAGLINGKTRITRSPFSTIKRSILEDNLRAVGVEEDGPTKNDQEFSAIKWGQTRLTIITRAKE